MLEADLKKKKNEDDMKTRLKRSDDQHFRKYWGWKTAGRKIRWFPAHVITPCLMSCTKHHGHLTTGFIAENCPKIIYSMITFEFANTVANSTEVQGGLSAKLHHMNLKRGVK